MGKIHKESQKKYIEKLKEDGKYEDYLKKQRERQKLYRRGKKLLFDGSTESVQEEILSQTREKEKNRKKEYRARKKNSPISPSKGFKTAQTRAKAIKKVLRAMPKDKKMAAIVLNTLQKKLPKAKHVDTDSYSIDPEIAQLVKDFFLSDEISYVSPVVKQRSPKDGNYIRNMVLSLREAYNEFVKRNGKVISLSTFVRLRPSHVKPFTNTPQNMCVCSVHSNMAYLVNAIYKFDKDIFADFSSPQKLIDVTVCVNSSDDCFLNKCDACMHCNNIKNVIDNVNQDDVLKEIVFKKWVVLKRNGFAVDEKVDIRLSLTDAYTKLLVDLPIYMLHVFIKHEQTASFKEDISLAMEADSDIAIIELDFAENYKCLQQDQTQNANFGYTQVCNIIYI